MTHNTDFPNGIPEFSKVLPERTEYLFHPDTGQWLQGKEKNNAIKELGRSPIGLLEAPNINMNGYAFQQEEVTIPTRPQSVFPLFWNKDLSKFEEKVFFGQPRQEIHVMAKPVTKIVDELPDGTKLITPISKIPNILDSFVEITEDNKLMLRHGLKKRNSSVLHLAVNTRTQAMNRYLSHMQMRLNLLVKDGPSFWKLAMRLATRSHIFKAIMLHEYNPHWHRDMNMKQVYLLINKYNLYWETLPVELKYRRVYIPKSIDKETLQVLKWRPLGVPTEAWRLYLHTWQQFLMIFLKDQIHQHQHGFYKGRGSKTAWEEVLTKVLPSRDIYEFDLKGFFPSVNTSYTIWSLKNLGLPEYLATNLAEMSLSYPRYESLDEEIMDETNAIYKYELDQLGLLRLDDRVSQGIYENEFCNAATGEYKGKVLKPIYDFIEANTSVTERKVEKVRPKVFTSHSFTIGFEQIQSELFRIVTDPELMGQFVQSPESYNLLYSKCVGSSIYKTKPFIFGFNKLTTHFCKEMAEDSSRDWTRTLTAIYALNSFVKFGPNDPNFFNPMTKSWSSPLTVLKALGYFNFESQNEVEYETIIEKVDGKELLIDMMKEDLTHDSAVTLPSEFPREYRYEPAQAWDKESAMERLVKLLKPLTESEIVTDMNSRCNGDLVSYIKFLIDSDPKSNYVRSVLTELHKSLSWDYNLSYEDNIYKILGVRSHPKGQHYSREYILQNWFPVLYEYWQVQSALFESFAPHSKSDESIQNTKGTAFDPFSEGRGEPGFKYNPETQTEGFPQGGGTSPILSSLVLGSTVFTQCQCTMYADDGMFYGTVPESIGKTSQLMERFGLSFAADKSSWVKKDGIWLKPLKYLGLIYDPFAKPGGELRAATRKGATLAFDKEVLIVELMEILQKESEKQKVKAAKRGKAHFYQSSAEVGESKLAYRIYKHCKKVVDKIFHTSIGDESTINDNLLLLESDIYVNRLKNLAPTWYTYLQEYISDKFLTIRVSEMENPISSQEFSWELLVKSKQFGFVQSRLYQNSWNSEVEQDFTLTYKPNSWSWYAQFATTDLSISSDFNSAEDGLPLEEFAPSVHQPGTTFFNPDVHRTYGWEPEPGLFTELSPKEFFRFLKMTKFEAPIDKMMKSKLMVKVNPRFKTHRMDYQNTFKPFLSVFNSSSYAIPALVNIFRIQKTLDSWRKLFKSIGMSAESNKKISRLLRLGYSPVNLYKVLIKDPNVINHIWDPFEMSAPS